MQNRTFPDRGVKVFICLCFTWWIIAFILLGVFDQKALFLSVNSFNGPALDWGMPYITMLGEGLTMAIVLIGLILGKKELRNLKTLLIVILSLTIPSLVTSLLKVLVEAPRPLKLYTDAYWVHTVAGYKKYYSYSWPSGHTTGVFSFFCLLSSLVGKKHGFWATVFFMMALLTGFSRIYLAQHFFEDVLAGSIIGTSFCYFIILYLNRVLYRQRAN